MRNPGALVFYIAVALYLLAFVPPAMRRIEFVSTIVARCTPDAAFALVSDPNNWHRYVPELELRAAVRTPVQVGDLIYDRFVAPDISNDGIERVIACERGVRFGTEMVSGRHGTTGVYEFLWVDGATRITFRCKASLTIPEAWLGNGFRRGYLAGRLKAARDAAMQRIKVLLEASSEAVTV